MDLNKEQKEIILWLVNNELNKTKDGHFNTEVLCEIREAINYNRCFKPKRNSKITCLITYWTFIDSGHAMIDDYRTKVNRIVEVDKLRDLNDKYNNLIDVKILK